MKSPHTLKRSLIIPLLVILSGTAAGQEASYCKGLKNLTSFVIYPGDNPANTQWYGFENGKFAVASVCGSWGMYSWGTQSPANQGHRHPAAINNQKSISNK